MSGIWYCSVQKENCGFQWSENIVWFKQKDLMILLGCNIVALFSLSAYIYLLIIPNEKWDSLEFSIFKEYLA